MVRPTVNRIACVVLAIDRPAEPHYDGGQCHRTDTGRFSAGYAGMRENKSKFNVFGNGSSSFAGNLLLVLIFVTHK